MNNPRLVLIEDNPADVLLVREAIRAHGIEVDLVAYSDVPDAIAGLENSENPLPDAVLIDLNLPKGEGMNVIKFLRSSARLRQVPLAILTSSESPRDLEEARSLEVPRYIHKPSTLNGFLDQVGGEIAKLLATRARSSETGCA